MGPFFIMGELDLGDGKEQIVYEQMTFLTVAAYFKQNFPWNLGSLYMTFSDQKKV